MGNLRVRLILLTATVAAIALVAGALLSRMAVTHEFQRLESEERGRGVEGAARVLSERLRAGGPAAVSDSALVALAAPLRVHLILAAPDGRVLAASEPELRTVQITHGPGGGVDIVGSVRTGGVLSVRRARILGGTSGEVRDGGGARLGTLYPFPRAAEAGMSREAGFLVAVNRGLLIAVLAGGALALLLALALSRRILGPVEALTRATRRLEAGDLTQRVTLHSRDEIGALARAFNAMAEALERNETSRRRLVADVAHELRTPLTNLRAQLEAIEDGLQAADPATLRSLHEETMLLARLTDDLQDLALAEAGRLPLHRERLDAGAALEAAASAIRPRAAARDVTLRVEVASATPALDGDPARLAQILRNLLENALAHTPAGGTIALSAAPSPASAGDGNHPGGVEITVADTGPGIAAEHLPHLFDRFYRADASRARGTGGSGLGLAIVRQLAELHGGSVRVASEPGRGARFTVSLPAAPS